MVLYSEEIRKHYAVSFLGHLRILLRGFVKLFGMVALVGALVGLLWLACRFWPVTVAVISIGVAYEMGRSW